MPSFPHEAPLTLLRERPDLAAHLLREVLGLELPPFNGATVDAADHTDLVPVERRADLVVTLQDASRVVMGILIEVQMRIVPEKRFAWPHYAAGLHERLRAPVCLLVLAADEATARWARSPITTLQPGSPFAPLVIGPANIPAIRAAHEARRLPELAVLSAMAHGNAPGGLDVVRAAIDALAALDRERQLLYFDIVLRGLNEASRQALEHDMQTHGYEWSDWAKEQQAIGRVEGRAEGVLAILLARGLSVPPHVRERVLAIRDVATLDRLVHRALCVSSAEELLGD